MYFKPINGYFTPRIRCEWANEFSIVIQSYLHYLLADMADWWPEVNHPIKWLVDSGLEYHVFQESEY